MNGATGIPKQMPHAMVKGRRAICGRCPSPCPQYVAGQIDHDNPAATCPLPAPLWKSWAATRSEQARREKRMGLGDLVAKVAQPIARVSDRVLGTKLVGCGSCSQRRARLNQIVSDVTRPLG